MNLPSKRRMRKFMLWTAFCLLGLPPLLWASLAMVWLNYGPGWLAMRASDELDKLDREEAEAMKALAGEKRSE